MSGETSSPPAGRQPVDPTPPFSFEYNQPLFLGVAFTISISHHPDKWNLCFASC
ncbi:hypothetical protein [Shimazuella soli]|uniref:hypothetical protein n=1 Tax=Shimazuella soli TaxID=1892854 RepID=UPI001F0D67EA|nr:hypothetical protein [Shimazuella soli]